MKLRLAHIIYTTALAIMLPLSSPAVAATSMPQPTPDGTEEETVTEDDEHKMLEGMVVIPDDVDDIDIPIPSFINTRANHIAYNGADWSTLREAIKNSSAKPVSIVHIGDSHVQADIATGTTRELLQYDFGNAGRGIVAPLKLSGTNQPIDYTFQSRGSWNPAKLMSQTWRHTMGFTGTSIRPVNSTSNLIISTTGKEDYNPFKSLTLFHNGRLNVKSITGDTGEKLDFRSIPSRDYTQIILPSPQTSVTIDFASAGDLTVYGASLSGDRPGVFYHAIGNNGAGYETYNRIGNVGAGISPLSPDLVIISLGTNEAFSKLNTLAFTRSIDRLVKNIRAANPKALILLTTPMECHRSVTTSKKVRVKGKKGKMRTVTRTSRSYAINANIAPLRRAILDYGKDNGVAVYDWYEVAGGAGASAKWISNNLFANDRVHHSHKGYNLEGRLVYEALMDALRDGQ